jgi:hypothetical protein
MELAFASRAVATRPKARLAQAGLAASHQGSTPRLVAARRNRVPWRQQQSADEHRHFLASVQPRELTAEEGDLVLNAFELLDVDKSGFVSRRQLKVRVRERGR